MELRQLKYFKEACELQNFSEAARVLHISQSTLSQQIKHPLWMPGSEALKTSSRAR